MQSLSSPCYSCTSRESHMSATCTNFLFQWRITLAFMFWILIFYIVYSGSCSCTVLVRVQSHTQCTHAIPGMYVYRFQNGLELLTIATCSRFSCCIDQVVIHWIHTEVFLQVGIICNTALFIVEAAFANPTGIAMNMQVPHPDVMTSLSCEAFARHAFWWRSWIQLCTLGCPSFWNSWKTLGKSIALYFVLVCIVSNRKTCSRQVNVSSDRMHTVFTKHCWKSSTKRSPNIILHR